MKWIVPSKLFWKIKKKLSKSLRLKPYQLLKEQENWLNKCMIRNKWKEWKKVQIIPPNAQNFLEGIKLVQLVRASGMDAIK